MKEVERQTKILQYVEEENSKKKQRQLKALSEVATALVGFGCGYGDGHVGYTLYIGA